MQGGFLGAQPPEESKGAVAFGAGRASVSGQVGFFFSELCGKQEFPRVFLCSASGQPGARGGEVPWVQSS